MCMCENRKACYHHSHSLCCSQFPTTTLIGLQSVVAMYMEILWFISNFLQDINTKKHSLQVWDSDTVFNCDIYFTKSKLHLYFEGKKEGSCSCVKTIIQHNIKFSTTSQDITFIFHPHGLYEVTVKGDCEGFGIFKLLLHLYKTDECIIC